MKINDICVSVLNLTDDDFKDVENAIISQKSYSHPLVLRKGAFYAIELYR